MKIPLFKRIFKTDYKKEEQDLVDKLAGSVNDGFDGLYGMINKNISLEDNLYCIVKTVNVTVDTNGNPKQSIGFKNTLASKIRGLQVINSQNLTNSGVYVTGAPFISFSETSGNIIINNIKGLPANNNFELTVIAWG